MNRDQKDEVNLERRRDLRHDDEVFRLNQMISHQSQAIHHNDSAPTLHNPVAVLWQGMVSCSHTTI